VHPKESCIDKCSTEWGHGFHCQTPNPACHLTLGEILQSWQVGNQAGPAVGGQQNVDTVDLPWQNFDLIQNNCITVTQKNRNENEWTQCEPQNEINVAGLSRRLHAELLQQTNTDAGVVWASKQTNNAQKSKVTEN
jgi:hypothetical protein